MPEKVAIAYRGAMYEIGRGKRYYGIWVTDAPASDPIDRWPENREGWNQAWARFTAIETPGTISRVDKPRAGRKRPVSKSPVRNGPRAAVAAGLAGLGVLLGVIGLFPVYVGLTSLASAADQLVPHLIYLVGWAIGGVLIAIGARRFAAGRLELVRLGALLGAGLSAVTFGLLFADLGEVISGLDPLGPGLVLTLLGWLACAAGSLLALTARPGTPAQLTPEPLTQPAAPPPAQTPPAATLPVEPPPAAPLPGQAPLAGSPLVWPSQAAPSQAAPSQAAPSQAAPWHAQQAAWGTARRATAVARPRPADAGPLALVVLATIGAVASFAPSWDSYTLFQSATGASQTVTLGNAFSNPGAVIAGNVAVMVAAVAVAVLAALWRPVRHGAVLLAGATVPLAAQAISALIQVHEPVNPAQFGTGVSITSGVTPIFWVYCVFVISLVVSCAWMLTAPRYPVMPAAPQSPAPGSPLPVHGDAGDDNVDNVDGEGDDSDDAEDDAESSYA